MSLKMIICFKSNTKQKNIYILLNYSHFYNNTKKSIQPTSKINESDQSLPQNYAYWYRSKTGYKGLQP